jgi:uncharacterized protein (TIGR03083 family)
MSETSTDQVLAVLTRSHERLAAAVEPLADDEVTQPSYADEWSLAQVLSHLGSGAEIFALMVDAGARGADAPGMDAFQEIWDRWNAMVPQDQVRNGVVADRRFLEQVEALALPERDAWRLTFFGGERDLADTLLMRLGEHSLHTWDVAVALDPAATLPADAVALLVDTIGGLAARTGKPGSVTTVRVATERPERVFLLESGDDGVRLTPSTAEDSADADGSVRLPAEALVRLVYGRLDDEHTPSTAVTEGVELDDLRRTFPGF